MKQDIVTAITVIFIFLMGVWVAQPKAQQTPPQVNAELAARASATIYNAAASCIKGHVFMASPAGHIIQVWTTVNGVALPATCTAESLKEALKPKQ